MIGSDGANAPLLTAKMVPVEIGGDGTIETKVWEDDGTTYPYNEYPWFIRGGSAADTTYAGIWAYGHCKGLQHEFTTSRATILRY